MDGTQRLVHWTSVVRVRPRTSRSITDLLLALACVHLVNMHGTREKQQIPRTLRRVIQGPRWDWQADPGVRCSVLHECETGDYSEAEVSLVMDPTRQITPPIRSGHAPPSRGSRKNPQSVNPDCVLTW